MKIAVISASIGRTDVAPAFPEQDTPCDYHYFTSLPDLPDSWDSRKKSKFPKILAHKLLPEYDVYGWIDASVRVDSREFVSNMMSLLYGFDIVCTTHPDRKNVYEEFDFMLSRIRKGDKYLNRRFTEAEIERQKEFFTLAKFPETYPLFSAGISFRWNSEKMNRAFEDWWEKVGGYGNYDQAFYSFVLHHHAVSCNTIDFKNRFFKVMPHP